MLLPGIWLNRLLMARSLLVIGLFKALLRGFRRSCNNTQPNKLALEHLEDRTMPTGFALQLT